MPVTRRDFLKLLGVGAGSLAAGWLLEGCKAIGLLQGAETLTPTISLPGSETFSPAATATSLPIAARLSADVSRVVGTCDPKLWGNTGYDTMYSHTVSPTTQPVWEMIRESGAFRYIRCHNTFSDAAPDTPPDHIGGCRVYSEDAAGTPHYDFQYLDQVLDIWLGAGLKPILEMDFMPDALAEGPIVRHHSGGAINTPRDYNKWRDLIYHTVEHLIERYGADEVRTWYFEIWNEPDLKEFFIDGTEYGIERDKRVNPETLARFLKMYDYFVDGATAADAQIKVGGPAIAMYDDFLKVFLDHITNGTNYVTGTRGTRADFISWHGYGTSQGLLENNKKRRALVRSYPALANAELHQNEWGQTLRKEEPTVLSEHDAVFLCRSIDNNFSDEDALIDLFLRWGELSLARQTGDPTILLPVFNAYVLLGKLGPERIAVDHAQAGANIRAFAARRSPNSAQIVVYRFEEENTESVGDAVGVELVVNGLAGAETVPLTHYRIDREHANAYRAWLALGSPKTPTPAQAAEMAAKAQLAPQASTAPLENGAARISFGVLPNAMSLIVLGEDAR